MKCFEGYTVEQIKEMSPDEIKVLWDKFADESKVEAARAKLIEVMEIEEAKSNLIEN